MRGMYVDSEGCSWSDAVAYLQGGVLGFCTCGAPEDNLLYVMGGLEVLSEDADMADFDAWWPAHMGRVVEHFGSEQAANFFAYWANDVAGLMEHGGSIPGWLTPKGHDVLRMLREWAATIEEVVG